MQNKEKYGSRGFVGMLPGFQWRRQGGARGASCPPPLSFWAVFPVRANPLRKFFERYTPRRAGTRTEPTETETRHHSFETETRHHSFETETRL